MKSKIILLVVSLVFVFRGFSHCEIPCGIYDDKARINLIFEHITTIEKSMNNLEKETSKNQIVRWVINKESHATKVQEIIGQYFLTQRIKEGQKNYAKNVITLQKMLVAAMKCKQTTDKKYIEQLRQLAKQFKKGYF